MITNYIDVDGKWGIVIIRDFDIYDNEDLAAIMKSFGIGERKINKSLQILSTYNSGMAVSNSGLRMSAIFIGKPYSASEFWSTVNHELYHVEQAILEYYGENWDGEPPAYLAGYLLKRVVEEIAEPCY